MWYHNRRTVNMLFMQMAEILGLMACLELLCEFLLQHVHQSFAIHVLNKYYI